VLGGFDLLYRGELRHFDDQFALLWTELEARGALDDTLMVFWTDHGEQFMERGLIEHANHLFAEENRATAAFWAKNLAPYAYTDLTTHQDIAATVADLYGLSPAYALEGLPVGTAPEDRVLRHFAYFAGASPQLGITRGTQTLLYDWDGRKSFFRNDLDPAQLDDAYDAKDPDVVAMWDALSPFVQQIFDQWDHFGPPDDAGP
jgi:arylsulfatase A-like enzyme